MYLEDYVQAEFTLTQSDVQTQSHFKWKQNYRYESEAGCRRRKHRRYCELFNSPGLTQVKSQLVQAHCP